MSLLSRAPAAAHLERVTERPSLVSVRAVNRVGRFDGRTRVVAVRDSDGWHPEHGPWTAAVAADLRAGGVCEVLLRRGWRRARVVMAWLPAR